MYFGEESSFFSDKEEKLTFFLPKTSRKRKQTTQLPHLREDRREGRVVPHRLVREQLGRLHHDERIYDLKADFAVF